MTSPSQIEAAAHEVASGDHACMLYGSDDGWAAATRSYVERSLADGAQIAYVAEERTTETLVRDLDRAGFDARDAVASGRLAVHDAASTYLQGGSFNPDAMIALLREQVRAAAADGRGFRIAGEVAWSEMADLPTDVLIDYERRVDDVFRESDAAALCLYDSRRLDSPVCSAVARAHPLVLCDEPQGPAPWHMCTIEREADGLLALRGEIDISNADSVALSLQLEAARRADVRVDLRDLAFIDAAGLRALQLAAQRVARRDGSLTLVRAPAALHRVIDLLDLRAASWLRLDPR